MSQGTATIRERDSCLVDLPLTIREIKLTSTHLLNPWPADAATVDNNAHVLELAGYLENVKLTDGRGWLPAYRGDMRPTSRRSQLDNFVAKLDNVARLTLSAVAVSDIGTLSQLRKLEYFKLVEGHFALTTAVRASELVDLLTNSTSLQRVQVLRALAQGWTDQQKQAVLNAAQPGGVFLWT